MKIREMNEPPIGFRPIELTLIIETKRELEMLWLIFNASPMAMTEFLNNTLRNSAEIEVFTTREISASDRVDIWSFLNRKLKQQLIP